MHNPIHISDLNLSFTQKKCFNNFSYILYPGEKIGLIGDNGSGKSSLLRILANLPSLPHPDIHSDETLICGYVPQIIEEFSNLSGGQRFNQALSAALANYPNLLLLDEPTNHLDAVNRKSLMRQLRNHPATQIIVTHDPELLNNCVDTLWHIHAGIISIFKGSYANYVEQLNQTKHKLLSDISQLKQAQKQQHQALMQEQQRAKSSREQGEKGILQRKWSKITANSKAIQAGATAGKKSANLTKRKNELSAELNQLWQAEEINYSFNFMAQTFEQSIVTINQGSCGYVDQPNILQQINFNLYGNTKIALIGANGSGKSTLLKAIMQDSQVVRHGEWIVPQLTQIAYLDQHYSNLPKEQTILEYMANLAPALSHAELRNFLNQFLFRKNEEIHKLIQVLSGGEKARLSLASIALQQPKLLILDEVSNNIDLTTREHLIKILKNYLGAMLIISHDTTFLTEIGVEEKFNVEMWQS